MSKRKTKRKSEFKTYIEKKLSNLTKTDKRLYKDTLFGTDTATSGIKNRFHSTFIIPFALALGASPTFIALLNSVPLLVGSFFQLFVADLIKLIKRRKEVIVFTSLLDAILWIPIMLLPFLWNGNHVLLLNLIILQSIALSVLRPFYNSLISDIIPTYKRGKILGNINLISSGVAFTGNIIFGFILSSFENINPFIGFAIIFLIQFFMRLTSTYYRSKYVEKPLQVIGKERSLIHFSKNLKKSNFGMFVLYSALIQFALAISGPFFTPYMIEFLGWDLLTYTIVTSASIISSLLVLKKWGRHIDQKGSKWMLRISGFAIAIVPIFWILIKNPVVLILVQFLSGASWAAYSLSTLTFIMDATDRKSRIIMNSYYYFIQGVFIFVGSMIGGFLMKYLPTTIFGSSYYVLFGISALLRFVFSLHFIPKLKEERYVNIKLKGKDREVFIFPHRGFVELNPIKRK